MEQKERTCLEILEISKPCCAVVVNFLSASTGLKKFFPEQLIPSSPLAYSCTSTAWTWKRTDRKISVSVSQSILPLYLTNYCHNWRWKSSLMLKKVACLTTPLWQSHSHHPSTHCWDWSPLAPGVFQWPNGCPLDSPHTLHSQTGFPHWLEPRFPTAELQMSSSFTLFNHASVIAEQKELPLVPLKRDTEKKEFLGFCPLTV